MERSEFNKKLIVIPSVDSAGSWMTKLEKVAISGIVLAGVKLQVWLDIINLE